MSLKLLHFRKQKLTSSAKRKAYFFYNALNFQIKSRHLAFHKKWNPGKNDTGRKVLRTRSAFLIKKKSLQINYSLRYFKLGFIASLKLIPFKNKLVSLVYFSNGAVTYYVTTELHGLFSFLYYNFHSRLKKIKISNTYLMLFQIKKLSFVSYLEISPGRGAQYCRSSGTKSKIFKFEKDLHSVLINLPSGVKKSFSYYSFAFLGKISLPEHAKAYNTKSGYWRSFGVKPIVRGVAMNPVDHPHGGRTKSIRYQRTPWGKTTKYK